MAWLAEQKLLHCLAVWLPCAGAVSTGLILWASTRQIPGWTGYCKRWTPGPGGCGKLFTALDLAEECLSAAQSFRSLNLRQPSFLAGIPQGRDDAFIQFAEDGF